MAAACVGDAIAVQEATSSSLAKHPLNTVAPYYTMFRPEFPLSALKGAEGWVLDPFCGRGTTNFAARILGLPSVGVDASPVAAAIASAKLVSLQSAEVVGLAQQLIDEHGDHVACPEGEFWEMAYHPDTLRELCAVRAGLLANGETGVPDPVATILRAIMLGALHGPLGRRTQSYLSNQMPRTYATKPQGALRYWCARDMWPSYVAVPDVVARRAERACNAAPAAVPGEVLHADSRSVEFPDGVGPFSHVVTSPPYYGMRTYVSDQWLRYWFLGGPTEPEYSADRQMETSSPEAFTADLARVWRNVADSAVQGCRMTVRFGALPSVPSDPREILVRSIEGADCGWEVQRVEPAGDADAGRRQARQFGFVKSKPITEIDVTATLRG